MPKRMSPGLMMTDIAVARQLHAVCVELIQRVQKRPKIDLASKIFLAFHTKATRTLEAVLLLHDRQLSEPAQALVRVLLELRITFDVFMQMFEKDARNACRRFADSMMLEKLKQQRQSGFAGLDTVVGGPNQQRLEQMEAEIVAKYTPDEVRKLRKFGFSGVSIEERAKLVDRSTEYDIIYRNFSRNVHSTDYAELFMLYDEQVNGDGALAELAEVRDRVMLSTATSSVGAVALNCNLLLEAGLQSSLQKVHEAQRKLGAAGG